MMHYPVNEICSLKQGVNTSMHDCVLHEHMATCMDTVMKRRQDESVSAVTGSMADRPARQTWRRRCE